jgi:hypothetical protein
LTRLPSGWRYQPSPRAAPPRPTSIGTAGRFNRNGWPTSGRNHRPTSSECADRLLAWIETCADDQFMAVFVGGGAQRRASAARVCSSRDEAQRWVEAETATLSVPVEWLPRPETRLAYSSRSTIGRGSSDARRRDANQAAPRRIFRYPKLCIVSLNPTESRNGRLGRRFLVGATRE